MVYHMALHWKSVPTSAQHLQALVFGSPLRLSTSPSSQSPRDAGLHRAPPLQSPDPSLHLHRLRLQYQALGSSASEKLCHSFIFVVKLTTLGNSAVIPLIIHLTLYYVLGNRYTPVDETEVILSFWSSHSRWGKQKVNMLRTKMGSSYLV